MTVQSLALLPAKLEIFLCFSFKNRDVDAGNFSNIFSGRIGRLTSSPAQLGQELAKFVSAQCWQNVHSKLQIRASGLSAGRFISQHSQLGFIFSIGVLQVAFFKQTLHFNLYKRRFKRF